MYLPSRFLSGSPLFVSGLTPEHVLGHIFWGMVAGSSSFLGINKRIRYFILPGIFAILLDSDHLLQVFLIENTKRMGHSLTFSLLAAGVMFLLFGKRDYRLAAISFGAVFSHISFDILLSGNSGFYLYIPFILDEFILFGNDWILPQIIAFSVIMAATLYDKKKTTNRIAHQE